jgi:hypothetical protein
VSTEGFTWASVEFLERRFAGKLERDDVPAEPGVYVWWHQGKAIYLGKAADLRRRIWRDHLRRSPSSVGKSTFKRSVAAELGIATRAELRQGRVLDETELDQVLGFIYGCEVCWTIAATQDEARDLEKALLAEHRPPLNLAA